MFFSAPFDLIAEKTTNSINMNNPNPCMTCGACCAFFRVSFYWAEADYAGGNVPASLTEQISPFHRCMRGTNQKNPRCVALTGPPVKTHIALFTKTARPHAGNSQCPEKMASRMKHVTAHGKNMDFPKSEYSPPCKNANNITSLISLTWHT